MRILSLSLVILLVGCTEAGLATLNVPATFDDETIIHDVAYGPEREQKLDIYLPSHAEDEPCDVLVFFYGGRWTSGAKEDYRFVGDAFASRGFVVVIPDYRKYPAVRFPVFIQDGAKALAWVYDNIETYHGDSGHIHVAGHSAGAYIGAMLAANPEYLAAEGKQRSTIIRSFAGLSGPYAFTPDEPDLKKIFGPHKNYPLMQVPNFIDGTQPPMLLLYGASDSVVEPRNLEKLQKAIETKGGTVMSIIYPHTDHTGTLLGLSWLKSDDAPVLDDMMKFFEEEDKTTPYDLLHHFK